MNIKEPKSQILSGLIVAGILALVQWVVKFPILNYIWQGIVWIWNNVFRIELELWLILGISFIVYILNRAIQKSKERNRNVPLPEFINYTRGRFDNCQWTWSYRYNQAKHIHEIMNLTPECNICHTPAVYDYDGVLFNDYVYDCPRCDSKQRVKKKDKVERVIIDNIEKQNY